MAIDMKPIVERAARIARAAPQATVELIGTWIWVSFPGKPSDAIRALLREEGFHWNRKRQCWQCGARRSTASPKGRQYLAWKYGSVTVDAPDEKTAPSTV